MPAFCCTSKANSLCRSYAHIFLSLSFLFQMLSCQSAVLTRQPLKITDSVCFLSPAKHVLTRRFGAYRVCPSSRWSSQASCKEGTGLLRTCRTLRACLLCFVSNQRVLAAFPGQQHIPMGFVFVHMFVIHPFYTCSPLSTHSGICMCISSRHNLRVWNTAGLYVLFSTS
jgi:hypothetical protein